jgi:hypothetical protein
MAKGAGTYTQGDKISDVCPRSSPGVAIHIKIEHYFTLDTFALLALLKFECDQHKILLLNPQVR